MTKIRLTSEKLDHRHYKYENKVKMCQDVYKKNRRSICCVLPLGLPCPNCARTDFNFKGPVS